MIHELSERLIIHKNSLSLYVAYNMCTKTRTDQENKKKRFQMEMRTILTTDWHEYKYSIEINVKLKETHRQKNCYMEYKPQVLNFGEEFLVSKHTVN